MTSYSTHRPVHGINARGTLACLCFGLCAAIPARTEGQNAAHKPVLHISAAAAFEVDPARSVRPGDTVVYRLSISWNEVPAAVRLNPREALSAPGFAVAGNSVTHERIIRDGEVKNRTDYVYALVPQESGTARIAPFVIRYHNGLTGREEELPVVAASLAVSPKPIPLRHRTGLLATLALAGAALLTALGLGLGRAKYARSRKHPKDLTATPPINLPDSETSALNMLRARCASADSRAWLDDAEKLCISWLCRQLGITHPGNVRFEAALDQYLSRKPGLPLPVRESWITLRDQFHGARYAPMRREPHELHDIYRHLKTCLLPDGP